LEARGNSPASPLGQPGLFTIRHAHSAPKVRNGYGITTTPLRNGSMNTVSQKRLQKWMNGNVTLETRRDSTHRAAVPHPVLLNTARNHEERLQVS